MEAYDKQRVPTRTSGAGARGTAAVSGYREFDNIKPGMHWQESTYYALKGTGNFVGIVNTPVAFSHAVMFGVVEPYIAKPAAAVAAPTCV